MWNCENLTIFVSLSQFLWDSHKKCENISQNVRNIWVVPRIYFSIFLYRKTQNVVFKHRKNGNLGQNVGLLQWFGECCVAPFLWCFSKKWCILWKLKLWETKNTVIYINKNIWSIRMSPGWALVLLASLSNVLCTPLTTFTSLIVPSFQTTNLHEIILFFRQSCKSKHSFSRWT